MTQLALNQDVPEPLTIEALTLEEGLPLEEVEQRIGVAYAVAGLKYRVVGFYLQDLDARGLQQIGGCGTTAQYAAHRFGMSRREARDLLAVGRALLELPEIDRAFAEGRLCWSKVRQLIRVVTPQHEEAWIEMALRLHIDELTLEVKLSRKGDAPRHRDDRKGLPEIRLRLNTALPPDVFAKWEQVRKKLRDESGRPLQEWECLEALLDRELTGDHDENGNRPADSAYTVVVRTATDDEDATVETADGPVPLDPVTAEMLACDAGVIDPALDDHEADQRIPPAKRRRVLARDRHCCRHCGSPHRLQVHHIIPRSKGGHTVMRNLITLCRTCHALIHAAQLVIVGEAKACRFETRDGRDLHGPGSPPEAFLGQPPPLIRVAAPRLAPRPLRLQDIPSRIDQTWWRRHAHLLRWSAGRGGYELQLGHPVSVEDAVSVEPTDPAGPDRVGTMCQPRPTCLAEVNGQEATAGAVRAAAAPADLAGPDQVGTMCQPRPTCLAEVNGQEAAAEALRAAVEAADPARPDQVGTMCQPRPTRPDEMNGQEATAGAVRATVEATGTAGPDRVGTMCQPRPTHPDEMNGQEATAGAVRATVEATGTAGPDRVGTMCQPPLTCLDEVNAQEATDPAGPDQIGTMCQPRPTRLAEVIGQEATVWALRTAVGAAKINGEAAGHILLTGPPGLGKTTLARAVASELGVRLHTTAGPFVRNTEALVKLLAGLGARDVLFVDEVHALPPGVAEGVYEAIEDRQVSLLIGNGAMARTVTLDLAPFTMIGATTDAGMLPQAFLGRFVYRQLLEFYETHELAAIIGRAAPHFGVEIEPAAAAKLGAVSRGTPRRGITLLRQLRDEAVVADRREIDASDVARTLDRLGIDGRGMGLLDRRYLDLLNSREHPTGVGQAARLLGVDAATLEREHEPYLIHLGLMTITPQGRVALGAAASLTSR